MIVIIITIVTIFIIIILIHWTLQVVTKCFQSDEIEVSTEGLRNVHFGDDDEDEDVEKQHDDGENPDDEDQGDDYYDYVVHEKVKVEDDNWK